MDIHPVYLMVAFGLCFTLQHKLPFLHGRLRWLDALLGCTFCTGFHSGWLAWLVICGAKGAFPPMLWNFPLVLAVWCFASAAGCYCLDALTSWLESNTRAS